MESEQVNKLSVWRWPTIGLAVVLLFWTVPGLKAFVFQFWDTWLGFIGLVGGLLVAAYLQLPPLRTALIGFAAGLALVTVMNVLSPDPTPCLQNSKGWDILRAYRWAC
jgi:hypothetical protein